MSFGALNAAALNRVALNAAAGTLLVLATASFTAEATVTAEQTLIHDAKSSIDCGVNVSFDVFGIYSGECNFTAQALIDLNAVIDHGSAGSWETTSVFQPIVYRTIQSSAGFDTFSSIEFLADSKIGYGDWTASSTALLEPVKNGAMRAPLTGTATSTFGTPDMSRGVWGDWENIPATLWVEADITSGGITTFDAHLRLKPTVTFGNDNSLTAVFINGAFIATDSSWNLDVVHTQAGRGPWIMVSSFVIPPLKTVYAQNTLSATATASIIPSLKQKGSAGFTSTATISIKGRITQLATTAWVAEAAVDFVPTLTQVARSGFTISVTMSPVPLLYRLPTANWEPAASFAAIGVATRYVIGDWDALASSLSGAVIISLVPAPESRIFKVSAHIRKF